MKSKKVKRGLSVLLSLVMLACLLPSTVFAAPPTEVNVNGEDILAAKDYTLNCGNGTAVYDPVANTLTLNNADINQSNSKSGVYAKGDLTIELVGDNTMEGNLPYGIYAVGGDIDIKGSGTLNITANTFGIIADNNLSISSEIEKLQIITDVQALRSEKGGTVTVGGEAFTDLDKKITIEYGKILAPLTELTVNGTDILAAKDYTVNCGDGEAVYDPDTNTLTLNNAVIDYKQNENDNYKGAIMFDGDLNINLIGENYITSVTSGIFSKDRGLLTITGDKLTINSVYYGIGRINIGSVTVDGANLDISVVSKAPFGGIGINTGKTLSVINGAYVKSTGNSANTNSVIANGGLIISDSTVDAYVASEDGYGAIASDHDILISNSKVTAGTESVGGSIAICAGNDLNGTVGNIVISDNSTVTVNDVSGNALLSMTGDIRISDSTVNAATDGMTLIAVNDFVIKNSKVEAISADAWGIYAYNNLQIEGSSDVTAKGDEQYAAIGGGNSFKIIPTDGELIDVWTGDSEETAQKTEDSPLSAETAITGYSAYFRSAVHSHVFDKQVVSDTYKASDPTCTKAAEYYKSCECGAAGTETFSNGNPIGHNWSEPEFSWSKDGKTCKVTFTCKNDPTHVETLAANVTAGVKTKPTCSENGVTAYTASVEFEGKTYSDSIELTDIKAAGHDFENGVCAVCGAADPNYKADDNKTTAQKESPSDKNTVTSKDTRSKSPNTGVESQALVSAFALVAWGGAMVAVLKQRKKKQK